MSEGPASGERGRARLELGGAGTANVATGVAVLDHLLARLAASASFDLALEVAPGTPIGEIEAAGRALGDALAVPLTAPAAARLGSAVAPADEALAQVAVEASGRPLLVTNVDLTEARVAGLATDAVARFLQELATAAGLTLHVRLVHGEQTQHVLEAIFKALGLALAEACAPRR